MTIKNSNLNNIMEEPMKETKKRKKISEEVR